MMHYRRFTFIFLITFFLVYPNHSFSQHILGAISAGVNLSQVDGDQVYGYDKVGLNIGPSAIIPFGKNKRWSVTLELLYSQLGSRQKNVNVSKDTIIKGPYLYYDGYRLSLNYVQIPVLVHYTDKRFIALGAGFLYGRLVGVSEYESVDDKQGFVRIDSTTLRGPYSLSDIEVLVDVRVRIYRGFWFDGRYSYTMFPIRTRIFQNQYFSTLFDRKQYNNVLTFRLVYIFNDILPDKYKKKKKEAD
ncbi:MAG: outer membrane beta-barrel protein [Bacteroidales bacterium]|jgi:hypothetical protein